MTVDEVIKHYGSPYKIGKSGHFSHGTAYSWIKHGFVPIKTQQKIEELTGGKLKADLSHCERK